MLIKPQTPSFAKIRVVGVGGGGCNAINSMISLSMIQGVDFIGVNTDAQALIVCQSPMKIQIGEGLTKGLGSGGNPQIGHNAAEESTEKIKDILQQNTTFLVKKIKEFQEKVEALERELGAVKNQMLYRNVVRETPQQEGRKEVPIVSASSGAVMHSQESVSGSNGAAPKQEVKSEPHPRSGNWKGEDVSIEKFFYMGGKR